MTVLYWHGVLGTCFYLLDIFSGWFKWSELAEKLFNTVKKIQNM